MIKILYIVTQSELGGAQRYIFDLAINLDKSQYEIHIAFGGDGKFFSPLEGRKIALHRLKHLKRVISPITDIKAYFELKNLIKSVNPDIVHLNSSKTGFLGSLAAKTCKLPKIIYTAHGFVFNESGNTIKKWIYKKAEISNAKRIHKIICVSEYDRQSGIKAGIPENKLVTIHNGIDPNIVFLPKDEARGFLISHTQIHEFTNSRIPLIGCIANFYKTKGLDILIQAMTKVDAQLVIIGDGAEKKNLQLMAYGLQLQNKILFIGQIKNAAKYLKAFDLFILSSRKEGLPYTILEAQTAQIPIVATKVGGVPEIIQDNKNGYLALPNNADDLADKINYAFKNPISSNLSDNFTLDKMLNKTIQIYKS